MNEKVDLKVCAVCGDKALGYNFNVITCESCKAFFRRNALLNKSSKCPFNNNCEITAVTRRFCQKCRLEKCFNIGMRKDLIMTPEDKVLKKKKIQENKASKRHHSNAFKSSFKKMKKEDSNSSVRTKTDPSQSSSSDNSSPESDSGNRCMIRSILNPSPESELSNCDKSLANWNFKANNNNSNRNYNKDETENVIRDITKVVLEEVQSIQIEPNSIESILCEAIKLEYEAYTSLAQTHKNSRELNDAERAKLNELIVANKALLTPVDDDFSKFMADDCRNPVTEKALLSDPALVDVINLTAIAIRRLIKMAKKINAFKNMCQEDQVALLKGGCTEMMILRSAMNYDSSKQSWKIPHIKESLSSLRTDVLKQARGNIYQEHEKFIKTFDPKWRSDENIVLILCAITLFTPDRPRVIHQDVIKLEQNSYYYLLRRYLESVYPGCEAKSTFLKLIQKIIELHKVNEEVINCYLDVNPSEVEPLLIEIFDLKH